MITAGVLVWANVRIAEEELMGGLYWGGRSSSYGFPVAFYVVGEETTFFRDEGFKINSYEHFSKSSFSINLAAALSILAAVAVTLEWWIRRRERARE